MADTADLLLGLDLGTRSVKALLLAPDGAVVGEASAGYDVVSPEDGWAETDPRAWFEAVQEAAATVQAGRAGRVKAIGLSGQMHGVVLARRDLRPARPAILWADTRAVAQLDAYRALPRAQRDRLGNPLAVGMAGPTLLWLRDNDPHAYQEARWALQPKDWLRLRLTGEAGSEPSDASATLLYDLEADAWAEDMVDALGLRTDLLAPLRASAAVGGRLTPEAAAELRIAPGTPVAAGAADAAAAALGCGLLDPGPVLLTVGTGAQILAPRASAAPDPGGRIHCFRAAAEGRWYRMAAIQNAGLALEWVRGVLGLAWADVYREAFQVPDAAGVVFHPYLSGERTPYFDPRLRGGWNGLRVTHARGHLLRAALEGVAFALRQALEALDATGVPAPFLLLAGGGTLDPRWRQLLADVLDRPLHSTSVPSASARGAAMLAGLATGVFSTERIATPAPVSQVTLPSVPGRYDAVYAVYVRQAAALCATE
ncbi:MAG TPA: xylulokinase [Candidatus Limnocylindrales bacterium]|nr:xylulokinase [Candidatus Limnocylindrales bacterium]